MIHMQEWAPLRLHQRTHAPGKLLPVLSAEVSGVSREESN
jgi:hypothetical protein